MSRALNRPVFSLQVSDDIVPIGDFKSRISEKIRGLRENGRPVVITQNGKAAAVLLSPGEFDRLMSQAQFIAAIQEGLDDCEQGRVVSDDELSRTLDARFGPLVVHR